MQVGSGADPRLRHLRRVSPRRPILSRRYGPVRRGFVEPHFFAGFSGGAKLIAPGLAGLETTLTLHDARRIAHPAARWGIPEGDPLHDDVRAIAAATGAGFALDVILDDDKESSRPSAVSCSRLFHRPTARVTSTQAKNSHFSSTIQEKRVANDPKTPAAAFGFG